mgnify:FL=1
MSPQLAAGANSGIQDPSLPAWPTAFGGEGSHHHHARAKRPGRPRAAKITQGGSPLAVVETRRSRSGSRSKPLGPRSDLIAAKISSAKRPPEISWPPPTRCALPLEEEGDGRRCPHALPPAEDCAAAASPQGLRPAASSATAAVVGGDGGGGLRAVWTGTPRGRRGAAASGERGRGRVCDH